MKVVVVRHPRENLKKCSLRHLHEHSAFEFLTAVDKFSYDATDHILLEMNAPPITPADIEKPILLLDSTWHLLPRIKAKITGDYIARSIPAGIKTAYPRKSKMHEDPSGLATIEALYCALKLMGIEDESILKDYNFAQDFFEINKDFLASVKRQDLPLGK